MWIGGEFNTKLHVQSKDEILYGCDDGFGSSKRRRTDMSKPVRFISTEIDHNHNSTKEEAGEFEKHTKGIGMKLLKKMGYKGGGLGLNGQGITAPIEAKLRPKNMGMGFNNDLIHKEEEFDVKFDQSQSHSRPCKGKKLWSLKKKAAAYITAEQVLAQAQKQERGNFKVIDMRGPEVRVLTNLNNAQEMGDVPLMHNVNLLVDIAGHDVQRLDSNLRNERETVVALRNEKEKLLKEAHQQEQQIRNMEEIMSVLNQMGEKTSLESLAEVFIDLQRRFPEDYYLYSCIVCSYALPLFIRLFEGWNPLESPTHGTEVALLWKKLLNSSSTYVQLLMEVVLPALRVVCWQARHPEPMLRFLESWQQLLPPCVLQSILDTVVMPKISAAVDSWDPRETIPIHVWIHPWLPWLEHNKLESCYNTIGDKLASFLHDWEPSEKSALEILSPWRTVFDPVSWERLMVRCIVPKLMNVMRELEINPSNERDVDKFEWVQTWVGVVPIHQMLPLMDVFFDKWQQVLRHWLCSGPDFEQVRRWYLGWKGLIHQDLCANEHVRFRLCLGLEMMNRAVQGALPETTDKRTPQKCETTEKTNKGGNETMRLKDVIELYAQEKGLLLKPKPGRRRDGHQIYGLGNVSIVIDSHNQQVLAQTEDEKWSPVSLEQLLELQHRPRHRSRFG